MSFRPCRSVTVPLALIMVLAGWSGLGAQVPLTLKEFHERVKQAKALPDDPLAAVHRLLSLPPVTQAVAPFRGNQTAILASPQNAFAMVRETDCSLTAFNAMYSASTSASSFNYASRSSNFDQQLHSAAGLTTTGGTFAGGCQDPGTGVLSNSLIYAGITPSQMRVGALATYNSQSGHNQLFTIVSKEDGTLVGITTQPDPTGAGANSYPYAVVAGDLNKDGINDLVTVNYALGSPGFSSVTVLLGKADGSFAAGVSQAVPGTIAQTLVVDDFDGDGKLDVVVPSATSTSGSEVTFFPGNGDGTLGTMKITALTGSQPTVGSLGEGSISGDFNGDGKKDLISAYGVVLLGKGDGTFTQSSTAVFSTVATNSNTGPLLAAGDFNKDGKLDVALGTGDSISLYFGNGDGTFTAGGAYASIDNAGYLTATDLDGDGNLDLFSGDATNGIFGGDSFTPSAGYALMGKGDGTFVGAPQTSASAVRELEDLNGDGKLDYVSGTLNVSQDIGSVNVYLGNGDGSFKTPAPVTLSPFTYGGNTYTVAGFDSFVLADVDGDGHLDLVALPSQYVNANPSRFGLLIALGKSDGTFQAPTFTPFPSLIPGGGQDYVYSVKGLLAAKRADGKSEIAYTFLAQDFNNQFQYYEGYATQGVAGDGALGPVATTDTYTGSQAPNSGQTVTNPAIKLVDLNGDGPPDLIQYVAAVFGNGGVVTTPQSFQVSLGKVDGTFGSAAAVTVVDNPIGPITVADVNGDGKPDLIGEGGTGNNGHAEIGVALGKGDGTFLAVKKINYAALPNDTPAIAIADFDGDGKADIAMLGFQPPYDSGVFPGNGDGTFQSTASGRNDGTVIPVQPIELAADSTEGGVTTADIDGDGKIDIVGPTVLINEYGSTTPPTMKTNTTTTLSATPATVVAGGSITFTATVTGSGATGTVSFVNGTRTLGSSQLNASGVAILTVTWLGDGSPLVSAVYSGDAKFNASTSDYVIITTEPAKLASQPTISASSYSITVGQSVTLTATVVGSGATPTGTVTFLNNSTMTLGTAALNGQGVATLVVSNFSVGAQSVSASYGGDSVYNSSVSGATTIIVAAATTADFAVALSPASASVTSGASATSMVTITPSGGFSAAVGLSCSGLPTNSTCVFAPASVTPSGAAATSTLTIRTGVSTVAQLETVGGVSLAGLGVFGLIGLGLRKRALAVQLMCLMLSLVGAAIVFIGCGSSSSNTGGLKTPAGTYTVSVTGTSGTTTHSAPVTLTVQ